MGSETSNDVTPKSPAKAKEGTPQPDHSLEAFMAELREEQGQHIGDAKEPVDAIAALGEKLSREAFLRALADACDVEHDGTGYTAPAHVQTYLGKGKEPVKQPTP